MGGQKTLRVVRAIVLSSEQREILESRARDRSAAARSLERATLNNLSSACRTTLGEMLHDDREMTVIWKTPS